MRLLYLLLLMAFANPLYSQLNIQVMQISSDANLDMSEFPKVKAYIKAFVDGTETEAKLENLLIMENGYTIEPVSAEYDGEWQEVIWITKRTQFDEEEASKFPPVYVSRIYWSMNNQITYSNMLGKYNYYPLFNVMEDNNKIIDISYGDIPPGNEVPYVLKINTYVRDMNSTVNKRVFLDSVTTETEFFEVEWMGSDSDTDWSPPPRLLRTDSRYWIKVIFKPQANQPYRDKLVFHYEGGFRKVIPLKGNSLILPHETILNITEPNGGEIFTPCEMVTIKWEGHSTISPVRLYYSPDGGKQWKYIDAVKNSSEYQWEVPADISDNVLLRVTQDFNKTSEVLLSKDIFRISEATYNPTGTKVVTANIKGRIIEWNLESGINPDIISDIQLNPNNTSASYVSNGVNYLSDDEFTVHYRLSSNPYNQQKDTLAYFKSGESAPYKKTALDFGIRIDKMISDFNNNYLFIKPETGNQVFIIEHMNADVLKTLNFNYPITDISISRNNILNVLLMNNELVYFDGNNDYTRQKSIKYRDLRWLQSAQIAPNSVYTSIAEYQVQKGQKYSSFLVHNDSELLARQFTPAASEVVGFGFNSTATNIAIGSKNQPQVILYDLTNNHDEITLPAHSSELHNLVLSPTGKSILTMSANSSDNIYYRTFTYPETDETDGSFIITKPEISNDLIEIEPDYLGHETEHLLVTIRNTGDRFIDIHNVELMFGENFRIIDSWIRDTINIGETIDIAIAFKPLVAGIINDTLIFKACVYELKVPLQSEGYARNLTFLDTPFDFGEVCVGETAVSPVIELFRNDDPVPLIVNNLQFAESQSPFYFPYIAVDTVLPPGGIYKTQIHFKPSFIGDFSNDVVVLYADQKILTDTFRIKGTGIGASIEYSHNRLLFIPEIPQRKVTVTNTGDIPVTMLDAYTEPAGIFNIETEFPVKLQPGEETIITVTQYAETDEPVNLLIDANPCLSQTELILDNYEGTSALSIPEVITKPTDDVEIPIQFTNTENGPYDGIRKFEAEFQIYYKLFFPLEATSEFGDAELTRNTVSGDIRTIGVRVDGEFPSEGTVVKVKGKPGLTTVLEGNLNFVELDNIWGTSIINNFDNGKLIIEDDCINKVTKETTAIEISSIAPNPAQEKFEVSFFSMKETFAHIEIVNSAGKILMKTDKFNVIEGLNVITLNINSLPPGNYTLYIKTDGEFASKIIIISR